MLTKTKTKIVLSTFLVVGFASTALASEYIENKIGDRYPQLEQTYQQSAGTSAFAYAVARQPVKQFTSAAHVSADGRSHHADPDSRIMTQLAHDCPVVHF